MTKQEKCILQEQANEAKEIMVKHYNEKNWDDHKVACSRVRMFRDLFKALNLEWTEDYFKI